MIGFVIAILGARITWAQEGSVKAVRVVSADGETVDGLLHSISHGEVTVVTDRPRHFAARDLIQAEFRNRHSLSIARPSLIQLINGDRIIAGLSSMSDDALVALWKSYPGWPPVRIPTETIAGVLMSLPEGSIERSQAFAQLFRRRTKSDTVLFLNGDRAAGEVAGFDQAALKLVQAGKPLQIELSRIRGILFNSDLSSLPEPKKPRVHITLNDRSQLTGFGLALDPNGPLRLTAAFGAPLELPLAAVSSIRFLDGRITYLSDLKPEHAEVVGFFGDRSEAFAKDQNIGGGPLLVREKEYAMGLGTRSRSVLSYDLGGRFRRFQAVAAIDDSSLGKGSAQFAVELDGRRVYESRPVTGADAPLTVGPLNLSGVRRLVLIVDYGELADVNDAADWCDAIVIE
jgi:hypothetical protein